MAEIFEGRSAEMKKNARWLASEDIIGYEPKVTIESVYKHENVEMEAGRKEKKLFAVKFAGKDKQLILNSTNRKSLVRMFGVDTKQWRGKTVTLYVDSNVKMMGKIVCGIRIKDE